MFDWRTPDYIEDVREEDLRKEMVGKSIVSATKTTLTLSDGTELEFVYDHQCCSAYDLKNLVWSGDSHIITDVKETDRKPGDGYDETFSFVVLAEAKELARVDVEGNEGTGYYLRSLMVNVRRAP